MVAACLRAPQVPPEVGGLVTEWAGGVPLLVEEILATLTTGGALQSNSGRWTVEEALSPVVPQSFSQSVQAHLNQPATNAAG
jgi:hypothetical protein